MYCTLHGPVFFYLDKNAKKWDYFLCNLSMCQPLETVLIVMSNHNYNRFSGLPTRNGDRHAPEIATLAMDLLNMIRTKTFPVSIQHSIQLRIGVNTGKMLILNANGFKKTRLQTLFVSKYGPCQQKSTDQPVSYLNSLQA